MCVACEKLRVAVGTSRSGVLSKTHFGDSRYFEIYEVTRKGWRLLEVRENRAADATLAGLCRTLYVALRGRVCVSRTHWERLSRGLGSCAPGLRRRKDSI